MESILKKITGQIRIDEEEHFRKFDKSKVKLKKRKKPIDIIPLFKNGFFIIAEVKKGSPSKGIIRKKFDPVDIASAYENSGANAISVITEKNFFFGKKKFLADVKKKAKIPVLRKDFILHPYQIYESYNLGADIILLIAACLNKTELQKLFDLAISLGMNAIIEVHNKSELRKTLTIKPSIIGINNRDLKTFKVDLHTSLKLKKIIPKGIHVISESGISDFNEIKLLKRNGFSGALIGESLLRHENITLALRKLIYG